jgi:hypothetical protein
MTSDARYDQARQVCACGCGVFVQLTVVQVHAQALVPGLALLPPLPEQDDGRRLPLVECVQCRTRYDAQWREVG